MSSPTLRERCQSQRLIQARIDFLSLTYIRNLEEPGLPCLFLHSEKRKEKRETVTAKEIPAATASTSNTQNRTAPCSSTERKEVLIFSLLDRKREVMNHSAPLPVPRVLSSSSFCFRLLRHHSSLPFYTSPPLQLHFQFAFKLKYIPKQQSTKTMMQALRQSW